MKPTRDELKIAAHVHVIEALQIYYDNDQSIKDWTKLDEYTILMNIFLKGSIYALSLLDKK